MRCSAAPSHLYHCDAMLCHAALVSLRHTLAAAWDASWQPGRSCHPDMPLTLDRGNTLNHCWFDAGPASMTLAQHQTSSGYACYLLTHAGSTPHGLFSPVSVGDSDRSRHNISGDARTRLLKRQPHAKNRLAANERFSSRSCCSWMLSMLFLRGVSVGLGTSRIAHVTSPRRLSLGTHFDAHLVLLGRQTSSSPHLFISPFGLPNAEDNERIVSSCKENIFINVDHEYSRLSSAYIIIIQQ